MEQIKKDKVSIKPRTYFIFGSLMVFVGLVFSVIASVFLFSIFEFATRTHGPMGSVRLEILLNSFPWWALILGILGLVLGIFAIRKYDFSYKFNPALIIVLFMAAVILASILIDITGLDNLWLTRGPMQGIMRGYMQNNPEFENYPGMQRSRGRMGNY